MHRPLLFLLLSAAVLSTESPAAPPARDHILLIAIDDLNDWVGGLKLGPGKKYQNCQVFGIPLSAGN